MLEAKTRGFLSRAITVGAGGAVAVTGTYGLASGNYASVEIVWAVADPMLGAMVTYYFGFTGKGT